MSKYHELVEGYRGWIVSIKSLQSTLKKMKAELMTAAAKNEDPRDWADLASDMADIDAELQENLQALKADIEHEYEPVPFKAARNAGIAGFWREAGLRMPT